MQNIELTKTFEIKDIGEVIITFSYDEESETYRPLGDNEVGTPEITDTHCSNYFIEKMEVVILGVGFLIDANFKKKLGKIKFNKLIDVLENASEP